MNGKTNASEVIVNQIVDGVLIPLETATDFKIGSGTGRAYFTWTDPVDKYTTPGDELVSEWEKTVVVRKKNSAPTSIDDGTVVLTETTRNQYKNTQYNDTSAEGDTTYYYSAFPVTTMGSVSDPAGDYVTIPIDGEPAFLKYDESAITYAATDIYSICASHNDAAIVYFGACIHDVNLGQIKPVSRLSNKVWAYNNEMTSITMDDISNMCLATPCDFNKYAIFHAPSTASSILNRTYYFDTDLVMTYQNNMINSNDPSVTTNGHVGIFAGGYEAGSSSIHDLTNRVWRLNDDLTVSELVPLSDASIDHARVQSGPYSIICIGNKYGSNDTVPANIYCAYDTDGEQIQLTPCSFQIHSSSNYWTRWSAYVVNGNALITYQFYRYYDSTVEYYDSELTQHGKTEITQFMPDPEIIGAGGYPGEQNTEYLFRRSINYQYGNYTHIPWREGYRDTSIAVDMSSFVRYDNDLVKTKRHLMDMWLGLIAKYPGCDLFPTNIAFYDKYMILVCGQAKTDSGYGTILFFTL